MKKNNGISRGRCYRWKKNILIGFLSTAVVLSLAACSKEKKDTEAVLTIGDLSVPRDEVMYYIYEEEAEGNSIESLYQSVFGESYWDAESDEGGTYRELAKERVMETAIKNTLFYEKAEAAGYSLTKEEETAVKKDADATWNLLTDKQKKSMDLSEKRLEEILLKISLSDKYSTDFTKSLDVDEEAAASLITPEEYHEYKVAYLYMPTVTYDEDYQQIPFSEEEKKAAYKTIQALLSKAQKADELSSILLEEESKIEASDVAFMEGDELLGPVFEKAALALKDGQTTEKIIEESDGYYIIRMIDSNSMESYENAVEEAVLAATLEAFDKAFEELKESVSIEKKKEFWESLVIGAITYDEEAMAEDGGEIGSPLEEEPAGEESSE